MPDSRLISPAGTARSDQNDERLLALFDSLSSSLTSALARITTLEGEMDSAQSSVSALEANVVYQVTFDTDGGSTAPDTQLVLAGGNAVEPSDPTKEGYTFNGWYNGATEWAFATDDVTESIQLVAAWLEQFTMAYDANTGTGTITDVNSPYDDGDTVTVLANTFTPPEGHVDAGWNTAANGSGTSYAPDETFTISADTTLYAQWAVA